MRVARNDLARVIQQVIKAVESRNTIPILGHIRLCLTGGKLKATATDLDIEITATATAEGDDCDLCVDAKMLAGIVGKVSGDTVDVEADNGTATIKAGRGRFKLPTLPSSDFPSMEAGGYATSLALDFAALLAPCAFAMSNEETRYYLNGVYLHAVDGKVVAVATDGHRLARHIGADANIPAGIIIPRKTVGLIPKGEVVVDISDTKIRITQDDTVVTSKLIDGTFPDYQRVIPTGNDKHITFAGADMIAAAERVATVSAERERGVKLTIGHGEIAMWLRGEGEANDSVPCSYDGEPVEIGFNASYLAELVGQLGTGDVTMAIADGGSPTLFTGTAEEVLAVLMPRRV